MSLLKLLYENSTNQIGHHFCIDVQPEYQNAFSFDLYEYFEYLYELSESGAEIIYFYNGIDTVGEINEDGLKRWILEELGIYDESDDLFNFIWNNITYYDKGYAFFRSCMDTGINEDSIISFVKFLYDNNWTDSRDLDEDDWDEFERLFEKEDIEEIVEFLKQEHDVLIIPELMDFISSLNPRNIEMSGGGVNECLREVELACMAMDLKYKLNNKYTY